MHYKVPVSDEESILKPLSEIERAIRDASTDDLMLLMIALNKQAQTIQTHTHTKIKVASNQTVS